jgi:hypothetical protein
MRALGAGNGKLPPFPNERDNEKTLAHSKAAAASSADQTLSAEGQAANQI